MDPGVPVRYRVPLINRVAAGYPSDFTDLSYPARVADEYVSCPGIDDPEAFAARVVGDSMLPDYREGDIVVFSPRSAVAEGSDCFVRLEPDHQTTFKRVFFEAAGALVRGEGGVGKRGKRGRKVSEAVASDPGLKPAAWEGAGGRVRLQPLNPAYAATVVERERVAGMYRAVWRMQRL